MKIIFKIDKNVKLIILAKIMKDYNNSKHRKIVMKRTEVNKNYGKELLETVFKYKPDFKNNSKF